MMSGCDSQHLHTQVHERVIRSVLASYLGQGRGESNSAIPRFLLNDVVRYWRTIAVDFAAKTREQGDKKWALRRIKLRTSRKLIFAAGLVMSLDSAVASSSSQDEMALLDSLVEAAKKTPLDLLAEVGIRHSDMRESCRRVFDAYETFLALIDDETKRRRLASMRRDMKDTDEVYGEAREIGRQFGEAIEAFFFDGIYKDAIRKYGVF